MGTIKAVIDDWDPIGLLSHAPSDEYHSEIKEIENCISSIAGQVELATEIYNIFIRSFGCDIFQKTLDECTQIANKIWEMSRRGTGQDMA